MSEKVKRNFLFLTHQKIPYTWAIAIATDQNDSQGGDNCENYSLNVEMYDNIYENLEFNDLRHFYLSLLYNFCVSL